jgi:DNA-binding MarR family transcriptional regulator
MGHGEGVTREDEGVTAVASRLILSMMRFGRALRRADAHHDDSGVYLLRIIDVSGPSRMKEVAALAGLDHSTVSRRVAGLIEDGQVSRQPDPTDGRASWLELTPAGQRVLGAALAARAERVANAMGEHTEADLADVVRVLDGLAANLEGGVQRQAGPRQEETI